MILPSDCPAVTRWPSFALARKTADPAKTSSKSPTAASPQTTPASRATTAPSQRDDLSTHNSLVTSPASGEPGSPPRSSAYANSKSRRTSPPFARRS